MIKKSDTPENALMAQSSELFAPLTVQPLFWRPRFRSESPLRLHAPFLLWLASASNARQIAVLGVEDGYGHFLFCQAIDKSNGPGTVQGIGWWREGKSGTPLGKVPEALAEHGATFYEDISELRAAADLMAGLDSLRAGSLDLLFVDLSQESAEIPSSEGLRLESLGSLLRESGLLVLHGTHHSAAAARLKANVEKLKTDAHLIEFSEGEGLWVIALGKAVPPRLQSLLALSEEGRLPREIAVIFRRLGQGLVAEGDLKSLNSRYKNGIKNLTESRTALESLGREMALLQQVSDAQAQKLADLQSQAYEMRLEASAQSDLHSQRLTEIEGLRQMLAAAETRAEEAAQALGAARAEAEKNRHQHEELCRERDEIERLFHTLKTQASQTLASAEEQAKEARDEAAQHAELRFKETAALTRLLESFQAQKLTFDKKLAALAEEGRQLRRENERLYAESTALRASTSWRVTAPIRKIKGTFQK